MNMCVSLGEFRE